MNKIQFTILCILGLLLAGCATSLNGVRGARVVGGGLSIKWEAPEKGTAYLVEQKSGKIIETRTLDAREAFTFDVTDSEDQERVKLLFGNTIPAEANFKLFFTPWL